MVNINYHGLSDNIFHKYLFTVWRSCTRLDSLWIFIFTINNLLRIQFCLAQCKILFVLLMLKLMNFPNWQQHHSQLNFLEHQSPCCFCQNLPLFFANIWMKLGKDAFVGCKPKQQQNTLYLCLIFLCQGQKTNLLFSDKG